MDNEVDALKDAVFRYKERFGHSFPMWQAGLDINESIELIKHCLQEGKSVFELGIVEDFSDGNIIY